MIVRLATTMDKLAARLTIIAVSRADHFIDMIPSKVHSTTKSAKREKPSPRYPPFSILTADASQQTSSHPSLSVCVHILLLPVNPMPPTESVQRDMI